LGSRFSVRFKGSHADAKPTLDQTRALNPEQIADAASVGDVG
jgi:hypothetical protein